MNVSLKGIVKDWDAKDIRNIFVTILALIIPIYFQTFTSYFSRIIFSASTTFTNGLYLRSAGNPLPSLMSMMFCMIITLPIPVLILNRTTSRDFPVLDRFLVRITKKSLFRSIIIIFLLVSVAFLMFLFVVMIVIYPEVIYSDFNKKLDSMAVFITQSEKNDLISRWALMANKADYTAIMDKISSIAKYHDFNLPRRY